MVALPQDHQGFVLIIIVVQSQIGYLIGPGTRVIEQVHNSVVPEPVFAGNVYALEGANDLLGIQEPDQFFLATLFRDGQDRQAYLVRIRKLERDNRELWEEIERLRSDEKYIESVARRELGLLRNDEILYRFSREKD